MHQYEKQCAKKVCDWSNKLLVRSGIGGIYSLIAVRSGASSTDELFVGPRQTIRPCHSRSAIAPPTVVTNSDEGFVDGLAPADSDGNGVGDVSGLLPLLVMDATTGEIGVGT